MRFARPLPPPENTYIRVCSCCELHRKLHVHKILFCAFDALSRLELWRANYARPKSTAAQCNSFGGQMTDSGALKQTVCNNAQFTPSTMYAFQSFVEKPEKLVKVKIIYFYKAFYCA